MDQMSIDAVALPSSPMLSFLELWDKLSFQALHNILLYAGFYAVLRMSGVCQIIRKFVMDHEESLLESFMKANGAAAGFDAILAEQCDDWPGNRLFSLARLLHRRHAAQTFAWYFSNVRPRIVNSKLHVNFEAGMYYVFKMRDIIQIVRAEQREEEAKRRTYWDPIDRAGDLEALSGLYRHKYLTTIGQERAIMFWITLRMLQTMFERLLVRHRRDWHTVRRAMERYHYKRCDVQVSFDDIAAAGTVTSWFLLQLPAPYLAELLLNTNRPCCRRYTLKATNCQLQMLTDAFMTVWNRQDGDFDRVCHIAGQIRALSDSGFFTDFYMPFMSNGHFLSHQLFMHDPYAALWDQLRGNILGEEEPADDIDLPKTIEEEVDEWYDTDSDDDGLPRIASKPMTPESMVDDQTETDDDGPSSSESVLSIGPGDALTPPSEG